MKKKLTPSELRIGMYICELDRPWLETTFLFQGFRVESQNDIDAVSERCVYVYVDTKKARSAVLTKLRRAAVRMTRAQQVGSGVRETSTDAQVMEDFRRTVSKARGPHRAARAHIDRLLSEARLGNSIDTGIARERVAELVDSVVHNPNALMWLSHMKRRDEYTSIHCVNVCILAIAFGRSLGLDRDTLCVLGLGALLHDIGKMKVPLAILNKPGRLTVAEFAVMREHPGQGHAMLKSDPGIAPEVLDMVLSHHEKLGGSGYPQQLVGEQIQHLTRIVTLVDIYDAITSDRVYGDGMTPHDALKKIYDWMPDNFDPVLTERFIHCLGIYPIGSLLELSSGHTGLVTALNAKSRLRPVIMLLMSPEREIYRTRKLINLAHPKWCRGKKKVEIRRIVDPRDVHIDITRLIALELHRK